MTINGLHHAAISTPDIRRLMAGGAEVGDLAKELA